MKMKKNLQIKRKENDLKSRVETKSSNDPPIYTYGKTDYAICILKHLLFSLVAGYLFFHRLSAAGIIFLFFPLKIIGDKKKKREKDEHKISNEFVDALNSLASAFEAGYAPENAFKAAIRDLQLIYDDKDVVLREFKLIDYKISMGMQLETALWSFAERTGIADVESFAEVFSTARRSGGNLIQVIRNTSGMIASKQEVKNEMVTAITEKKLEAEIMRLVPYGILVYFHFFSGDFLTPLYTTQNGILTMVGAFFTCTVLSFYTDKLTDIEV